MPLYAPDGVVMRAAIFALLLLASCAAPPPERFLTQEQDDEFRARCEQTGCVVVPVPLWQRILEALKAAHGQDV